jgi:hypothetical protein
MNPEHSPGTRAEPGTETHRAADTLAERQAEESADTAEDQRRQRNLDEAEMGGES